MTEKKTHGEAPVMQELWKMLSTLSLPSLPGLLWLGMITFNRVLSMGQIEQFETAKPNDS